MRIVIVNTHIEDRIGGSQVQCDLISKGLYNKGHEVIYLAIDKSNNYTREYEIVGVKRGSHDIAQKVIELKPDIVYWRFNKRYLFKCARAISKNEIKIVFAVSNIKDLKYFSHQFPSNFTFKTIQRFVKKNLLSFFNYLGFIYIDGITVNNENHLKFSPKKKRIYVPNALSDSKVNFEWERPFIVWVANIKNRKRPELFVKLADSFKDRDIDFLMIGNITDSKYDWIQQKDHTPSNFYYLGKKNYEEVNGILSESLFLVSTSTPEGFSNNIMQAWMQKKPVIAFEFDPGGLIKEKKLGYVCNSEFETFLDKVNKLLQNQSLREQIGNRAGEYVDNYFSKWKSVDLIESFMLEISEN